MTSTFVKMRKINSVSDNISYLQNEEKHPGICHSYSTCSNALWEEYAQVNRDAFAGSGQNGKCIEAHEAIFVFPREFYRLSERELYGFTRAFADALSKKYGVDVFAAIHGSDEDEKNMHIHLMYMERRQEQEQEKIAKRNMFFDPAGRQVRAKKDAVDPEGNLLPGYRMVPKGECYGKKSWSGKDKKLRSNQFTKQLKITWTNQINAQKQFEWAEDMDTREVYDHATSPYLPMQDVHAPLQYKNPEKQKQAEEDYEAYVQDIKASNNLRKEYNRKVDQALQEGANKDELIDRRKNVSQNIKKAVESHQKAQIREIIKSGINTLEQLIKGLKTKARSLFEQITRASGELQHKKPVEHVPETPDKDRAGPKR